MCPSPDALEISSPQTPLLRGRRALLDRQRWLVFVLPLAVYMAIGAVEPKKRSANQQGDLSVGGRLAPQKTDLPAPDVPSLDDAANRANAAAKAGRQSNADEDVQGNGGKEDAGAGGNAAPSPHLRPVERSGGILRIPYRYYPLVYTIKIGLTLLAIFFVLPGYREFPLRVSPLAVLVGAAGIIVWIGLCQLRLEQRWLVPFGMEWFVGSGVRSGLDPSWMFLDKPAWQLWGFLAVRLCGLVVVVAVIEEFFLRGFLMRYVASNDWTALPIGASSVSAAIACVVYAVLTHPAEMFAAAAWFLLVTLLAAKTKNIWDCVVAHATTNLLLGIYILAYDQFQYW